MKITPLLSLTPVSTEINGQCVNFLTFSPLSRSRHERTPQSHPTTPPPPQRGAGEHPPTQRALRSPGPSGLVRLSLHPESVQRKLLRGLRRAGHHQRRRLRRPVAEQGPRLRHGRGSGQPVLVQPPVFSALHHHLHQLHYCRSTPVVFVPDQFRSSVLPEHRRSVAGGWWFSVQLRWFPLRRFPFSD